MLLSGGMYRLLKKSISPDELQEAHTYLKLFVAQAPVFYGKNESRLSKYRIAGDFQSVKSGVTVFGNESNFFRVVLLTCIKEINIKKSGDVHVQ